MICYVSACHNVIKKGLSKAIWVVNYYKKKEGFFMFFTLLPKEKKTQKKDDLFVQKLECRSPLFIIKKPLSKGEHPFRRPSFFNFLYKSHFNMKFLF